MALRRTKVIAVDENFFNNVFEKQRKKLQSQLGVMNLSQANFTSMIKEIKFNLPRKKSKIILKTKIKKKEKRNDFFNI